MVVTATYRAPDVKQFTVVSEKGSKFILDHVFRKLLDGEQEVVNRENRGRTALSTENYDFSLAGYENSADRGRYILDLMPKPRTSFSIAGRSGLMSGTSLWHGSKESRPIGSGVLAPVNASVLKPIAGGAHSGHTTDTGDRLQLQETHRGNEGAHANRARGFLMSVLSLTGPFGPISRGPNRGVKLDGDRKHR
ncbi:MAG: hypothetical protein WCC99_01095 [Candidatus Sulfotelmatobacter sp.]